MVIIQYYGDYLLDYHEYPLMYLRLFNVSNILDNLLAPEASYETIFLLTGCGASFEAHL